MDALEMRKALTWRALADNAPVTGSSDLSVTPSTTRGHYFPAVARLEDQWSYTIERHATNDEVPEDLDLAAHPSMGLAADDIDRERNAAGEESQDPSREH